MPILAVELQGFLQRKHTFMPFPGAIPAGREKLQRFHSKLIRTEEQ